MFASVVVTCVATGVSIVRSTPQRPGGVARKDLGDAALGRLRDK